MRFAIAVSMLLACAAASAQVYKWKDKNGVWHYGDQPKHDAEQVEVRPSSGTGEYSAAEMDRQARNKECQEKRAQLETWRRAPSLSEIDNLGKQREYTKAERDQFLANTEKKVQEICSRPPSPEAADSFPPPAPSGEAPPPSRSAY